MPDRLIFLEFVDQAQDWLKELKGHNLSPSDFTVISFHPKVKVFLQEQGISCQESFQFCNTQDHGNLLKVLQGWTEEMRQLTLKDEEGVKEAYRENLIFFARTALSGWLYRAHVCLKAIQQFQPKTVYVVEGPLRIEQSPLTEASERYLADIVGQIKGIALGQITSSLEPSAQSGPSFFTSFLQSIVASWNVWTMKRSGKKTIMGLVNSHNMDLLLRDLSKSLDPDYQCVFLGNRKKGTAVQTIWQDMVGKELAYRYLYYPFNQPVKLSPMFAIGLSQLKECFAQLAKTWNYQRIQPANWIVNKYNDAFEQTVIKLSYYQSKTVSKLWKDHKPWLVVSQHARGLTAVAGELARIYHIPSLIVPHGSFTPLRNSQAALEWRENALGIINTSYDYVALQTPLSEEFLNDISYQSKPLITGPLIIGRPVAHNQIQDDLKKKLAPQGERIILHASTPKHRQAQRFLNYETIDEYVQCMVDLIKAVDRLKGYKLILRFRPIDGLTQEELKKLLPESPNYTIESGGNFNDYLAIADLLVSFSSTTMEEALLNHVTVLQYDKFNRYEHIPGALLSSQSPWPGVNPVYTVHGEEDLSFALKAIQMNHLNSKDNWNKKDFGYDQKSCINLAEWIKRLQSKPGEPMVESLKVVS